MRLRPATSWCRCHRGTAAIPITITIRIRIAPLATTGRSILDTSGTRTTTGGRSHARLAAIVAAKVVAPLPLSRISFRVANLSAPFIGATRHCHRRPPCVRTRRSRIYAACRVPGRRRSTYRRRRLCTPLLVRRRLHQARVRSCNSHRASGMSFQRRRGNRRLSPAASETAKSPRSSPRPRTGPTRPVRATNRRSPRRGA